MKRLLSLVVVALLICAMAIPAFSADDAVPTNAPVIDGTRANTITIHKFDPAKVVKNGDDVDVAASVAANAGVAGATFTAFKVLAYDPTTKTYDFTADFAGKGITLSNVIQDANDKYTSYGTTSELEKEINIMQKVAGTLSGDASATTIADGSATINLGAKPGVYLVMETVVPDNYIVTTQAFLVSAPTFEGSTDTWVYDVTALPKNQKIDVDKSIDSAVADTNTNDSSDAYAVGDIVDYTVTVAVPNYGRSTTYPDYQVTDAMALYDKDPAGFGVTRFNNLDMVFTDTLSAGLTFLPDSLKVKVSGDPDDIALNKGDEKKTIVDKASETSTAVKQVTYNYAPASAAGKTVGDYTLTQNGQTVTVDVAWAALNDYQGQTITLTYSAQVNENAVAGTNQNNTMQISFVNDPTSKKGEAADPTKPPTDTDTDDDNDVYTYAMDMTKLFDNAADAAKANDVVFTLSKGSDPVLFTYDATAKKYTVWTGRTIKNGDNTYAVPATYGVDPTAADYSADASLPSSIITDANKLTANISPLNNGVLNINGLKDGTYTLTETKTADGYSILTAPLTIVVSEVKDPTDSTKVIAKVSATVDGNAVTCNDPTDGHFKFDVNNPKAKFFSLPTTGGLGLWLFTVGGGILMAGAIIFITVLRKKRNAA